MLSQLKVYPCMLRNVIIDRFMGFDGGAIDEQTLFKALNWPYKLIGVQTICEC